MLIGDTLRRLYDYIPDIGDTVHALGQSGMFQVVGINTAPAEAEIELLMAPWYRTTVPWGVLTLIEKVKPTGAPSA